MAANLAITDDGIGLHMCRFLIILVLKLHCLQDNVWLEVFLLSTEDCVLPFFMITFALLELSAFLSSGFVFAGCLHLLFINALFFSQTSIWYFAAPRKQKTILQPLHFRWERT
ncbi:hypothetical protein XENOCAPTIV_008239 [Xenoophorus captivus]|uniref:Uncharacterized protein n=1 Tax=Xenoophorus captivus TaxID=1517983 RepID=A0ABV0QHW6_9TELE